MKQIDIIPEEACEGNPPPELLLRADGMLVRYEWDDGVRREYIGRDVSREAFLHLDRRIGFGQDVTLHSLFKLLSNTEYRILDCTLTDCFVAAQVDNYLSLDASKIKPYVAGEYHQDKIEYLELYWVLEKDGVTKEMFGFERPDFHGVGVELQEEYDFWQKGSRIPWSVSATPLEELLSCPLRTRTEAVVTEGNSSAAKFGYEVEKLKLNFSLRNVIVGVLWDLSFYGTPGEARKKREEFLLEVGKMGLSC